MQRVGGDFFTIFARTTHTGTLTDYIYYRTLTALARAGKGQALLRSVRSFLRTLFFAPFFKKIRRNPAPARMERIEIIDEYVSGEEKRPRRFSRRGGLYFAVKVKIFTKNFGGGFIFTVKGFIIYV